MRLGNGLWVYLEKQRVGNKYGDIIIIWDLKRTVIEIYKKCSEGSLD